MEKHKSKVKKPKWREQVWKQEIDWANHFGVYAVITENIRKSRDFRADILGPYAHPENQSPGAMFAAKEDVGFVILPEKFDVEYVVHEVYHLVSYVMRYVGAEHEEEIMAYHIGWLTSEISKLYLKIKEEKDLTGHKQNIHTVIASEGDHIKPHRVAT